MKLSPTWRRAWRRFSVQAMGWALMFIGWWQADAAPDIKAIITPAGGLAIVSCLLVAGIIGSIIDQPSVTTPQKPRGEM